MIQLSSRLVFASVFLCLATALLLASPLTERQSLTDRADVASVDDPHIQTRLRIEYKISIANDLVLDAIDLRTATAEFIILNSENEVTMNVIRDRYEGKNDFEKMARNVIDYARTQIEEQPDATRELVKARLASELEQIIHRRV